MKLSIGHAVVLFQDGSQNASTPGEQTTGIPGGPPDGPTEPQSSPFGGSFLVPMTVIAVIFWFLVIGPERKQRKKREAMLGEMKKGDKVMTTGGLYGSIVQIQDDVVTLQVDEGVRLRFARSAIQGVVDAEPREAKRGAETRAET